MALIEKKHVKNVLRTRPAEYRDNIKKKDYLLVDRQEFNSNTAEAVNKKKKYYESFNLNHYPQVSEFYTFLSKLINEKKEKILITEGCTGGIKQLIESYSENGSNIVAAYPTFILYSVFAKLYNVKLKKVNYNTQLKLTADSYIEQINKKTSIVFLTNPGAPNDFVLSKKEIERICNVCKKKNIIVALDDAYFPYYNLDLAPLVKKFNNLIVLRTFSKYYGLASLRVGYIIADKKRINYLSKFRGGYEINTPTIEISKDILRNKSFFVKKKRELEEAKIFCMKEFKKKNIKVKSFGNANYLCVSVSKIKYVNKVANYFYKKKIAIKYNLPSPFEDCILFTLTNIKDIKKIIKIFFNIYNKVV